MFLPFNLEKIPLVKIIAINFVRTASMDKAQPPPILLMPCEANVIVHQLWSFHLIGWFFISMSLSVIYIIAPVYCPKAICPGGILLFHFASGFWIQHNLKPCFRKISQRQNVQLLKKIVLSYIRHLFICCEVKQDRVNEHTPSAAIPYFLSGIVLKGDNSKT